MGPSNRPYIRAMKKLRKKRMQFATFPLEEIMAKINTPAKNGGFAHIFKVEKASYSVNLNSHRLQLFKQNHKCVICGAEGAYFGLDKDYPYDQGSPHFNLYTKDHVLMTKDHIVPKSKGGANCLSNYQTMCTNCNCSKSDRLSIKTDEILFYSKELSQKRKPKRQRHPLDQYRLTLEER